MRGQKKTCVIGHSKRLNSLSREISLALNLAGKTQYHGFHCILLPVRFYSFGMLCFDLLDLVAVN